MSVQLNALEAISDEREHARVSQRYEEWKTGWAEALAQPESKLVEHLLMTESGLFTYLDHLQTGNERTAHQAIVDDIRRLGDTRQLLDCIP